MKIYISEDVITMCGALPAVIHGYIVAKFGQSVEGKVSFSELKRELGVGTTASDIALKKLDKSGFIRRLGGWVILL